jgi:hypothetical protein
MSVCLPPPLPLLLSFLPSPLLPCPPACLQTLDASGRADALSAILASAHEWGDARKELDAIAGAQDFCTRLHARLATPAEASSPLLACAEPSASARAAGATAASAPQLGAALAEAEGAQAHDPLAADQGLGARSQAPRAGLTKQASRRQIGAKSTAERKK